MIQSPIEIEKTGVIIEVVADALSETIDLSISADYSMEPGGFAELTADQARALVKELIIAADYIQEN